MLLPTRSTTRAARLARFWQPLAAALASGCLLGLFACSPPEPVRIGFLGGLSGRVADLGIGGRNGAILAVELQNQQGGIKQRPVELLVEDDQQDATIARQAVASLLTGGVEIIIGPMTSTMALAVLPQMNAARVPLLAPTVTTNTLTGLDDYFFRVVASTAVHAPRLASYYFRARHMRRVLLIWDRRNAAYSASWTGDFRQAFERLGGRVSGDIGFAADDSLPEVAARALAEKPDGVVIIANSLDTALLIQQLRRRDEKVGIGTAEWAATERLIELGGRASEGVVVAQFLDRESTAPAYLAFRRAYRERFGQEPGFAGLSAFDATNVALAALAGKAPAETLKQAILRQREFAGAQSPIRFDANGDTDRGSFIAVIRAGEFTTLAPEAR